MVQKVKLAVNAGNYCMEVGAPVVIYGLYARWYGNIRHFYRPDRTQPCHGQAVLKKSLFPAVQVAVILASRAAAFLSFF